MDMLYNGSVSLVIPALNEGKNLQLLLRKIPDCVDETNDNDNGDNDGGDEDNGGNNGDEENNSSSGDESPFVFGGANGDPLIGQTFVGQVLGEETSVEEQIASIQKKIAELKKLLTSAIEKHIMELLSQLIKVLESEIERLSQQQA